MNQEHLTYLPKKAWALRSHWRRMLLMVLLWLVLRGRRGSVPRLCGRRRHRMHSTRPTRSSRARGRARRSRRTRRSRHELTESGGKLSHAPTLHPCTEHRVARATNVVQIIRPIRTNFFPWLTSVRDCSDDGGRHAGASCSSCCTGRAKS